MVIPSFLNMPLPKERKNDSSKMPAAAAVKIYRYLKYFGNSAGRILTAE